MKTRNVLLFTVAVSIMAALPILAATAPKSITTDPKVNSVIVKEEMSKTGFTPSDITAYEGQKITFELIANDAEHGFKIDAYKVDKIVKAHGIEKVTIDATKLGTFPITSPVTGDTALKGELKVLTK